VNTGIGQEINKETELWLEGDDVCYLNADGVKAILPLKVSTGRTTVGFHVMSDKRSEGAVTNFQFYAWVGGKAYHCKHNARIPYIYDVGMVTQVVNGVTNEFRKLMATEYVGITNNVKTYTTWTSLQYMTNAWKMINVSNDFHERMFIIEEGIGPAQDITPLSTVGFEMGTERFSFIDFFMSMVCGKAYALSTSYKIDPLSGTIQILFTVSLPGMEDQVTKFDIAYQGDVIDHTSEIIKKDWWEGDTHYTYTKCYQPNVEVSAENWNALNNWWPSGYDYLEYSWTGTDGVTYHRSMNQNYFFNILGSKFKEALAKARPTSGVVETTIKEEYDCDKYGHYYPDDTCICEHCDEYRGHNFELKRGRNCYSCVNKRGNSRSPSNQDCDGKPDEEEMHGGWHHTNSDGTTKIIRPTKDTSPGSIGYYYYCTCECGHMKLNHNKNTFWYVVPGDENGNNKYGQHTKVYECSKCEQGWSATVESHIPDGDSEVFPFDTYDATTKTYHKCPPTDPNVDKYSHALRGKCKPKNEGCGHDIGNDSTAEHKLQDCVCTECLAVCHYWYETPQCPKVKVCKNCGKHFHVVNGIEDLSSGTTDSSVYKAWHTYGPEGQIEGNKTDHVCLCPFHVLHGHNFVGIEGTSKIRCENGASDGTEGCLMELEHSEETHNLARHFGVHGKCGNWRCDVCYGPVTMDENSNTLATVHGTYADGQYTSFDNNFGKYCAVCNHKGGGTLCGTYINQATGKKEWRDPFVITDWRAHKDWKEQDGAETISHKCWCGYYSIGGTRPPRPHNDNTTKAVDIGDDELHQENIICNAGTGDDAIDNCNYDWTEKRVHAYVPTGVYHMDELTNTICRAEHICHKKNKDNVVIGCNHKRTFPQAHVISNVPPASVVDNEKHKYNQICENCKEYTTVCTNKHMYTPHVEITESTHHVWYECDDHDASGNPKLSDYSHAENMPCGNTTNVVPLETHFCNGDLVYRWTNNEIHTGEGKCTVCEIIGTNIVVYTNQPHNITINKAYSIGSDTIHAITNYCNICTNWWMRGTESHLPGYDVMKKYVPFNETYHAVSNCCENALKPEHSCGQYYLSGYEQHIPTPGFQSVPKTFVNNTYHTWSNLCAREQCHALFPSGQMEVHGGMDKEICDKYRYTGSADHITLHEHEGSNYCASCQHYYLAKQHLPCVYDWGAGSQWVLTPDTNGYDKATCYWCNDYGLFPHAWRAVDDRTHYCENGKGHLQGLAHVWDDPATSNYCNVCGWSREGEYETSFVKCDDDCDCGVMYRWPRGFPELSTVVEVRCFYWNWNTMHCDCPGGCTKEGCICKTLTNILKITYPNIHSEQYKDAFVGSAYKVIDMDDPVYNVMTRGFYRAFMNMSNLKTVNCSAITNCDSEAFYMAFSNCTALTHVDFHRLRTAGGSSFFSAFKDDTDLKSVDFLGLENAAGYSFSYAFQNAFDVTGTQIASVSFGVKNAFDNAFDGCFYNSGIMSAPFNSLTNAGNYAFRNAFYGCNHLGNGSADFNSLESVGNYCFWYAYDESDFNGNVNFPKLKNAGNYAFEYAFNNCMVTNVNFSSLEKAGASALCNAFANGNNYALKTVNFGSITNANGVFGTIAGQDSAFRGCTNVSKWVFSKLVAGEVELPESYANTDVDARHIGSNAVVDVSRLHNLSRIHFDEVENIVNYNADWIPLNTDWTASVPHALYETWIAKPGWSTYATNFLCGAQKSTAYDYYMAETGSDDNDGLTWKTPKRTLRGVWNAANKRTDKTDFTCSVSMGTYYASESRHFANWNDSGRINKRVKFIAVDGSEKTVIRPTNNNNCFVVSLYLNSEKQRVNDADSRLFNYGWYYTGDGYTNELDHVWVYRYQTFNNFTFNGFGGFHNYENGNSAFGGLKFNNCKFVNNRFTGPELACAGAVNACIFNDCTISQNKFDNTFGDLPIMFSNCEMKNCSIIDNEITYNGMPRQTQDYMMGIFHYYCSIDHCYVDISNNWANADWNADWILANRYDIDRGEGGTMSIPPIIDAHFSYCTFVVGPANHYGNYTEGEEGIYYFYSETNLINRSDNCYYCIGTNYTRTGGIDNVFGVSWTNTFLNANGYPTNGCPAIRVGMPDAGWKQHVGGVPLSATLKAVGEAEFRYEPNGKFDKIKSHPERFLNEK